MFRLDHCSHHTQVNTKMHTSKVFVVLFVLSATATGRSLLANKEAGCAASSNNGGLWMPPGKFCPSLPFNTAVSLAVRGNGSDTAARCSNKRMPISSNARFSAKQLKDSKAVEDAKMMQAALGAVPDYMTFVKAVINVRAKSNGIVYIHTACLHPGLLLGQLGGWLRRNRPRWHH